MTQSYSNPIGSETLRRWVLRALLFGLALGAVAAIAALLN